VGTNGDHLVALFVGNDWRRKGLDCAIDGLCRTHSPWELWVIGEDRRGDAFRRAIPENGRDRVRFLGQCQTLPYFMAANALLFPSRFDPLSNVVLEAMACGVPVIVSPNDGAAEIVRPSSSGFVLDHPADGGEIAARLDALADPKTRAAMQLHAESAVAHLTWERHFAQIDELLARVAKEKAALRGERRSAHALEPA
jgi:UDP-glucose:(heptosyl)LPS alpha-1,3-glucosyltransferase